MTNEPIYYRSISLQNVRCFGSEQTLYFTKNNQPDGEIAMWNVILGGNGTGKTTVLRALFCTGNNRLGLSNDIARQIYNYYSYLTPKRLSDSWGINIQTNIGCIAKLTYSDMINDYVKFFYSENGEIGTSIESSNFPEINIAYGATRKIGTLGNNGDKDSHFKSLFDENATLDNPEEWLIQADYLSLKNNDTKPYRIVSEAIKKLMTEEVEDFEIRTENNRANVYFKTHYGWVRLHDLSLGYKTLLAWITNLAKSLVEQYPDSPDPLAEPAVCLVDEIDLHMHPKMQRSVVKFLRTTFPKTQFIVTAHSPLIVQSEEETNVILLRRKGDEVEVVNDIDYVTNWRIDQILNSDLFGGLSPYGKHSEEKLKKRREIILKDKPTKADKQKLAEIDESLSNVSVVESPEYLQTVKLIEQLRNHAKN